MTNKKLIQMAIVVGLVFGLVASIPDIIRYVIVQNAIQDFTHAAQESLKESEQRTLKFKREMTNRKAIQAQEKLKKEADDLYKNAACILVEGTGVCTCIDKRTARSITLDKSTCRVRAREYNY